MSVITRSKKEYPEGFDVESFESLRKKLLDISGRSRLLNLKHTMKSFVRIIDEAPDQLSEILLKDEFVQFLPVPTPSETELIEAGYLRINEDTGVVEQVKPNPSATDWAKHLGYDIEYDLSITPPSPHEKHNDKKIQSVIFEEDLNTRLKKLYSESRTSMEETGNNILFLCFGSLEYQDSTSGWGAGTTDTRSAPLFLIPVEITKQIKNGLVVFELNYSGEDVITNLTLKEKLSHDFGLNLPDVYNEDDELKTPEVYFNEIKKLLKKKKNDPIISKWQLKRYGTLCTLSLGKLLMYKDLDPSKWPNQGQNLTNHEIIKRFFNSSHSFSDSSRNIYEDYTLDDVEQLHHYYPMVEDADSSQMSSLIDVMEGNNLVIEGPPGTGKSQTITNIIATAMSQRKSILFVAEKQAALDVVKTRLDNIGLGDFCLDIHSDKIQKKKVHESLKTRIDNQSSYHFDEDVFNNTLQFLQSKQEELQNYVQEVNSKWDGTDKTIQEILMSAARYQNEVNPEDFKHYSIESINNGDLTSFRINQILSSFESYFDFYEKVKAQSTILNGDKIHPWAFIQNSDLSIIDETTITNQLEQLSLILGDITQFLDQINSSFNDDLRHELTPEELKSALLPITKISTPHENIKLEALNLLSQEILSKLNESYSACKTILNAKDQLIQLVQQDSLENLNLLTEDILKIQSVKEFGISDSISVYNLLGSLENISQVFIHIDELQSSRVELIKVLSPNVQSFFEMSESGIESLAQFLRIIDELPETYIPFRDDVYKNDNMVNLILNFQQDLDSLNSKQEQIEFDFILLNIPSEIELELIIKQINESSFLSWFDPKWYKMKKNLSLFFRKIPKEESVILGKLNLLLEYVKLRESIQKNNQYRVSFKNLFQGVSTDISKIQVIGNWYQKVIDTYGIGFGQSAIITEEILSLPQDVFRGIKQLINKGVLNTIFNICSSLEKLRELYPKFEGIQDKNLKLNQDVELKELESTLTRYVQTIQKHLKNPDSSQEDVLSVIQLVNELKESQNHLNKTNINSILFNNSLSLDFGFNQSNDFENIIKLKDYFDELQSKELSQSQIEAISKLNINQVEIYKENSSLLVSTIDKLQNHLNELNTQIKNPNWSSQLSILNLSHKIDQALQNKEYIDGWLKFLYAKERVKIPGLEIFSDDMISKNWDFTYTKNSLLFLIYRNLSASIYERNSYIAKKSGQEQEGIRKEFSKLDEELKSIQRQRVASLASDVIPPPGTRGTRVSEYTQDYLVQHEINKKTRHIAIRSLIKRAGKAIQAYKPCFMMSPMAAAKFIEPGQLEFDLVIMDEASQVKQEFALSCFARGKQVVVVGDPKQLPPTDFFEKSTSNEDDEDAAVITDSESILEAISGFTPKRMLKWHYRSKHESLIAFSNHQFYDSRLIVFPSPYNESDDFGIKLRKINDGVFDNGFNSAEAEQVVDGVINHLRSGSTDSLGVVTMNAKQKEHIENLLEMSITSDPELLSLYNKDQSRPDPIFVKNLENVQGDERDIIVISFTYGPKTIAASSIPQRFGPINNANGWRRLNVLFTRSKKKMIIYSSMSSAQIITTENSSRGVHALKDFLAYAESGHMPTNSNITGKEPDSDFEIAVNSRLEKSGFECVPQVGVGGYFIDIAVRNPNSPGEFIMGIECDGATYHSSKSSRDRDKVRQGVLEGLGWNIRRIWSTDWFKNQEAEIAPIINELKKLSSN